VNSRDRLNCVVRSCFHKVNRRQAREGPLGDKVNRRQARQGELRSKRGSPGGEGPLEERVLWRRGSSGGEGPLEEKVLWRRGSSGGQGESPSGERGCPGVQGEIDMQTESYATVRTTKSTKEQKVKRVKVTTPAYSSISGSVSPSPVGAFKPSCA